MPGMSVPTSCRQLTAGVWQSVSGCNTAPDHEQNTFWNVLDVGKVPAAFVELGDVLRGSKGGQELQIHEIQEIVHKNPVHVEKSFSQLGC